MAEERNGGRDPLKIANETILVEIPRGDELLRVRHVMAMAGTRPVSWHDIRLWYKTPAGEVKPGSKGITIRALELAGVIAALSKSTVAAAPSPKADYGDDAEFPF